MVIEAILLMFGGLLEVALALLREASAYEWSIIGEMGGFKGVTLLAITGYIIGLLACIAYGKIVFFKR